MRLSDIASLQSMVTVVDAGSIFGQLNTLDLLADRGWQASEGDRRTVPQLLCDQLEFADLLLVNKADLVSEAQLGAVEALIRRVNPKAEVLRTKHSKVEPALILGSARFDMKRAEAHPHWLREAREHEHTPETVEYGISSFIFRARLPFHSERLHGMLGAIPRLGALSKLLRVKGVAWLAGVEQQGVVALAGTQFSVSPGQQWWVSVSPENWPPDLREGIRAKWHEQHGDRRTKLVCIGQDLDHAAVQAQLEACLLTAEEMAASCARPKHAADEMPAAGKSPLMQAAQDGNAEEVRRLLGQGASPNVADDKLVGATAVHIAAAGQAACLRLLLDAGGDANAPNRSGSTPVHNAAYNGFGDCLRLLLENGGKVVVWNKYGRTPLDYAEKREAQFGEVSDRMCVALLREWTTAQAELTAEKVAVAKAAGYRSVAEHVAAMSD